MTERDIAKTRRTRIAGIGVFLLGALAMAFLFMRSDSAPSVPDTKKDAPEKKEPRIPDCDATALKEGRPLKERPGCMVPIKGGVFQMGAQSQDKSLASYDPLAENHEAPVHEVEVGTFWLHMYEVSVHGFIDCVSAGGCKLEDIESSGGYFNYPAPREKPREGGSLPMNGITWFGARDYCAWIGARLPTEAEWEYAARGGARQLRYPWTPGESPSCQHLVFGGGAKPRCGYRASRQINVRMPRGEHPEFYVVHLAGNVWEWVADWYAADYYGNSAAKNPPGPAEGTHKVQRGGGWSNDEEIAFRTSHRAQMLPQMKLDDVGFRCAADSIY